jgi:S1-C subfamily serine protease
VAVDVPTPPNAPNIDRAALQARLNDAQRRLEVAAQQLAALSAQMSGPMMQRMQHFEMLAGPPHVLFGLQLESSRGEPGARVLEVSPGGPAQRAGVRSGDLIVAVNGAEVRGRDPALRVIEGLHGIKPGEKVDLRVSRDGKVRDLTLIARPSMNDAYFTGRIRLPHIEVPSLQGLPGWGGPVIIGGPVADMELAKLTPALGRYFGTDTGVLVVRAPPKGALGLQDGDVILSIDGRKPIDSSHVVRILGSYDPGEKITLKVVRQHRDISFATTVPQERGMPPGMLTLHQE